MRPKIIAIQTARANSKSVKKKNLIKINGEPIFLKNLKSALNSKKIDKVVCSTDDKYIIKLSQKYKYDIVERPKYLRGDKASHFETIKHALLKSEKKYNIKFDIIILLLGNAAGNSAKVLNQAINKLKDNDCVVSVSKFNMFNPFRAFYITNKKKLVSIIDIPKYKKLNKIQNKNDKNAFGDIYFFNGSFFVFKRSNFFIKSKQKPPFTWMGKNIVPFKQKTFFEIDDNWQIDIVKKMSRDFKGEIK
jgi:N-acylneuraminate cytidylyltransferase